MRKKCNLIDNLFGLLAKTALLLRIPLHYLSGKNWLNGVELNAMTSIKVARILSEVSGSSM